MPNIRNFYMKQKEKTILKEEKSEFIFSITEKKKQLQ